MYHQVFVTLAFWLSLMPFSAASPVTPSAGSAARTTDASSPASSHGDGYYSAWDSQLSSQVSSTSSWISMRVATIDLPRVSSAVNQGGAISTLMVGNGEPIASGVAYTQTSIQYSSIYLCLPVSPTTIPSFVPSVTATADVGGLSAFTSTNSAFTSGPSAFASAPGAFKSVPTQTAATPSSQKLSRPLSTGSVEPELSSARSISTISKEPKSPSRTTFFETKTTFSEVKSTSEEHSISSSPLDHDVALKEKRDRKLQEEDSPNCLYPAINGYRMLRDSEGVIVLDLSYQAPWGYRNNSDSDQSSDSSEEKRWLIGLQLRL